ncbi:MAG: 6-bladed beta-propeller [Mediterranea sp.]|jgi:hypothetical protein|nr:6-bladed beta-propeller [Mediterranea sp.]
MSYQQRTKWTSVIAVGILAPVVALNLIFASCSVNTKDGTEKVQKNRDKIVNVKRYTKEIQLDSILIGSVSHLYLLDNNLIISDPRSPEMLIHIFDKNTFEYRKSIAPVGQGPNEITILGHIATDVNRKKLYVSDHGKNKIFSYDMDSLLRFPRYSPITKVALNQKGFPSWYQYINDTLSIGVFIEPTSESAFNQSVARWNMVTGEIERMKYVNPDVKKKRMCLAVSSQHDEYVECFRHNDLLTICSLDGTLKYNVYGPKWDKDEVNSNYYWGGVIFCGNHILALNSGKSNSERVRESSIIEVFSLNGDYVKTLDVGYKIKDFCYDESNNRLILCLNDEIQFAMLPLNELLEE